MTAFPLQYSYTNTAAAKYDLPLSSHTEYEIIRCVAGTCRFFIADSDIELEAGDTCIIPGKTIHGDSKKKGIGIYESIVFDVEIIRHHGYSSDNFLSQVIKGNLILSRTLKSSIKDVNEISLRLFESVRKKDSMNQLIATGYIEILFGLIEKNHLYSETYTASPKEITRHHNLEAALNYIHKNYAKSITLDKIAKTTGMNPRYFCKIFKEMTGKSPIEYLNWYRINKACVLLKETELELSDVAKKCGFSDLSYFVKTFRLNKETTPLQYRKS